jgi:pimeloyl-ACP methyl ester carboxylesterase
MKLSKALLAALPGLSAAQAILPGLSYSADQCIQYTFNITATARNRVAKDPPSDLFSNAAAVNTFLAQPVAYQNVSGTYSIFGEFCFPTVNIDTLKLQVLVHGNTFNHTYWSALGLANETEKYPERSWINAARGQGYYTLALDRLGSGLSSRPDPAEVVQDPLQTEILHEIISQFRHFSTVVYVGHSFGSGLGVHLAATHPEDVDGLLLTGIAEVRGNPAPGTLANDWASVSGEPGYLKSTNKTARRDLYFYGDYDLAEADWEGQGTVTTGEFLTTAEYLVNTPKDFDKPVFVMAGSEDAIFCSENGAQPADCSVGNVIAKTKEWFPAVPAQKFGWFSQPASGHVLQLQQTAPTGFKAALDWLHQVGL